jgi:F0F1-type ATP synthase delta subunit
MPIPARNLDQFVSELSRRELKALAERYATALVEVALENKQTDQLKRESRFCADGAGFAELNDLSSPVIARAVSTPWSKLVETAPAARRNYLFVIVDQRRAGLLPEIEQAFSAMLDAKMGVTQALVTSATTRVA